MEVDLAPRLAEPRCKNGERDDNVEGRQTYQNQRGEIKGKEKGRIKGG